MASVIPSFFMKRIKLTKNKYALIDNEDHERISQHKWCVSLDSRGTKYYARRRRKKSDDTKRWTASIVRMHHEILDVAPSELPPGCVVDHINHNSLDCRKLNLEIITQEENMCRSAGWNKKKVEPWL